MKNVSLSKFLILFAIYMALDFGSQFLFYSIIGLEKSNVANAVASMLPLAFLLYNFDVISRPPVMPLTKEQKAAKFLLYAVISFVMVFVVSFIMEQLFN